MSQGSPENPILVEKKKKKKAAAQKIEQSVHQFLKSGLWKVFSIGHKIKWTWCVGRNSAFFLILSSLGNNNKIYELFNHDCCMMLSAMQKYAASHFLSLQQSFVEGAMIYYHCFIDVITCSELHSYHVAGPKFEPMFVWVHGSSFYSGLYCSWVEGEKWGPTTTGMIKDCSFERV